MGGVLKAQWAAVADHARDVLGEDIHPASVSIGDREIINAAGQWVGDRAGIAGEQGPVGPAGPPGPAGDLDFAADRDMDGIVDWLELALGTGRLAALIGQDAARDMLIDTRSITAKQAREIGLASDLIEKEDWEDLVSTLAASARALPTEATTNMLALTGSKNAELDLAALVRSAARPGLKARIEKYRNLAMRELQ